MDKKVSVSWLYIFFIFSITKFNGLFVLATGNIFFFLFSWIPIIDLTNIRAKAQNVVNYTILDKKLSVKDLIFKARKDMEKNYPKHSKNNIENGRNNQADTLLWPWIGSFTIFLLILPLWTIIGQGHVLSISCQNNKIS